MKNFEDGNYVAAAEVKYKLNDFIRFYSKFLYINIKGLVLAFFELIKCFGNLFFPSENKVIRGQLALVTGGANGLGRAIAKRLAKEGCNIAVADIDLIGAENVAKEIELEFNVNAKAFKVDVSNYEEVLKLRNDIEGSIGTVDILVNNAGILAMMTLEESRPQDIQRIINVNLTSHFWVSELIYEFH